MEHLNLQALADNLSLFAFIYLCVFGAIVMDLWSGVRKARRRHELRMSNGYKRTVDKIARYYNMLLVVSIMDALLIVSQAHSFCSLPCLPYLTIIGALFLWLMAATRAGWPVPRTTGHWGSIGYAIVMTMLALPVIFAEIMVPMPDPEDESL